MKNGYVKKMIVGGLFAVALAGLAACGSDSGTAVAPVGKVVKGPVNGAKVYDGNNNLIGTTNAKGEFSMTSAGPYTTSGGTYIPLDSNGNPGAPVDAPQLKAPAGYAQITPLSTIVAKADNPAQVEHDLIIALAKMGVTDLKTADFSVKTSANGAAIALSESVGAILASASSASSSTADAAVKSAIEAKVTQALVAVVTSLANTASSASAISTDAITSAISTTVASVVGSDATITAALPSLASTLTSSASTAASGADKLDPGALPAPTTSTTGSTGGTGGTSGLQ